MDIRKPIILLALILCNLFVNAQEKNAIVDEVAAIVGNFIVKKSEIEEQYLQYRAQGFPESSELKCKVFEELLYQKLLLNQSKIDSLSVSDNEVESEMDRRMKYFLSQMNGSVDELEKYFDKSIIEIKEELRSKIKEQQLIQKMQQKVTENIKATPSEINKYYTSTPKDSLPEIPASYEFSQIVLQPKISKSELQNKRAELLKIRERIINGEDFQTMAILYSEDPGSAANGGELGFVSRGQLVPEYEAIAYNLTKEQISEVIETKFGFHIIQLIERRGEKINTRHILLKPKVNPLELKRVSTLLDSIRTEILNGTISFEEAALRYSTDIETKNNGGRVINEASGSTIFDANSIDPSAFFIVDKLKLNEISKAVPMKTKEGDPAYRIIKLIKKTEAHLASIETDYQQIQEFVLQEKQSKRISDWIELKTKSTYIYIKESYNDCNFMNKWVNIK